MSVDYDTVSYVISSKYRERVAARLAVNPATPSTISDETGDGIAHISRAISGMREEGLVELLVSEDRRKGRLYGLTDKGREVYQQAENMGAITPVVTDGGEEAGGDE